MKKKLVLFFCIFAVSAVVILISGFGGNRLLFYAIERNDFSAAELAVNMGAWLNTRKYILDFLHIADTNPTPLIAACKRGNHEIVKLLVECGVDVNKKDNYTKQCPLLAALHGNKANRFSLGMYLIEHGADIHSEQRTSSPIAETILVLDEDSPDTVQEGFALFQYLIEHGVGLSIPMSHENALTYAAHYNNPLVIQYLIDNQYYDVNSYDNNQNTALIVAAKEDNVATVRLLLSFGADPSMRDINGMTAYDHAVENQFTNIASLLTSTV